MFLVPTTTANLKAIATSIFIFSLGQVGAFAGASVSHPGMPIAFEQNQGQAPSNVKFISRGASGILLLSQSEIALRAAGKGLPLRLKLRGTTATSSAIVGSGERGGTVNYFYGSEPSGWLTGIPSYTQVTYKNVYPHMDLVVYGNNRQFESDFVLGHDADPSAIALQVNGKVAVRADGSLSIQSGGGAFTLHRPFVYQLASNGERVAIDCHYTVGNGNNIGFAVGNYDHAKALVIDPVLSYSTYLGGGGDDSILGVTGDLLGNVYVTGQTMSLNFPTANPEQPKAGGSSSCFVAKLDPTGQHLIYATYLGGSSVALPNGDRCNSIAVNLAGEAFVGGTTYSTNFPTKNPIQGSLKGTQNGFVTHLDCTGSRLIFSTYLGGGGEFLTGVAVDLQSNVYATGLTNSVKFPTTKGAFQTACGGACQINAFLSKISASGCLIYSTYLGGSSEDSANGVAVDLAGSAYVAGEAHSTDFPTKNAYQPKIGGTGSNAFVTKFSPDGSSLCYSTYVGGENFDSGRSIAVDLLGDAYVAGYTNSTKFPTVNAFQPKINGYESIFVFKLNTGGSALNYSTYLGGSQAQYAFGISVDLFGNAAVSGNTISPDFPVKAPVQAKLATSAVPNLVNAVVANFNTNGGLNYSTYLGGGVGDYGYAVYSDPFGCVWVGGQSFSANFPVTASAFQRKLSGNSDGILTRLAPY